MGKKSIFLILCFFCFTVFSAGAGDECYVRGLAVDKYLPDFGEDVADDSLFQALATSINYYRSQPADRTYDICGRQYNSLEMTDTLTEFGSLLRKVLPPGEISAAIKDHFEVCMAAGGTPKDASILVTGYFEPVVEGSLVRSPPYIHPIYSTPPDLVVSENGTGMIRNGRLVPYWSRAEIEAGDILAGKELVYLEDKVEAFVLHVQGSGKVRLRDGRLLDLQFAAKNGRPYRSIGKLLVERGKMEMERVSLPAIIGYLQAHPQEINDILNYNESFVFFRWGERGRQGPLGSLGRPLTPGRSVALDNGCFPPGVLAFLETRKPLFAKDDKIVGWAPFKRFVLGHDTGSAIRGSGRLDLFMGSGPQARSAAGNLKSSGRLYFLVKKK